MITCKRISFDDALPVLSDPEIFSRIAEGSASRDRIIAGAEDIFVGTFDNGLLFAVWWLSPLSSTTIDLHAHVLASHRDRKYQSWRLCLLHIRETLPKVHKLQAFIPTCFPEVYHFAKRNGMKDEGLMKEAELRDGCFFDLWVVGNTVEEMLNEQG